jgi:hypothetical protein
MAAGSSLLLASRVRIFQLLRGFLIEPIPLFILSAFARLGPNSKRRCNIERNPQVFTAFSLASLTSPRRDFSGGLMEAVYFIGAFVLLVALIYGTLNWHFRDRRKDPMTDQIVRDRYEHNRT